MILSEIASRSGGMASPNALALLRLTARGQDLLTIWRIRNFFAVLIATFSEVPVQKDTRPRSGDQPKWHSVEQKRPISEQFYSGFSNTGRIEGAANRSKTDWGAKRPA